MAGDMLLALNLAGLGMLFVFSFLALLVLLISLNAWLIRRIPLNNEESEQKAAMIAAAAHHRRKRP